MTSSNTKDPWSISIKAVGVGFNSEEEAAASSAASINANGERQFVVEVSPEDGVASLHAKIEGATGLKASQQRLIYRGRLIGKFEHQEEENDEPRIKDIAGLCDGQTIHLVKKRDQSEESNNESNSGNNNSNSDPTDFLGNGSASSGGGSLLAALLGLSNLPEEISNEDRDSSNGASTSAANVPTAASPTNAASTSAAGNRGPRWGWRSSRIGRPRRPHYRLTAEDLQVNDPGSMEPVRQGLMTLHTLLPHAQQVHADQVATPLEANREWFRGQWIDCRDTVNQWLEATVVEIMSPEDILPPRNDDDDDKDQQESSSIAREETTLPRHQRLPHVANDPAVSASDLDGRRRLLLEACDPNDSDGEEGSISGYRRRSNNDGVQLLLIHYNGWPHRWDEWIRSDSERIRPFRTRTRHPNVSSTASPTPQSVFNDAPSTNIRSVEEEEDRAHLLPELARTVGVINDLLNQVAASDIAQTRPGEGHNDLPWVTVQPQNSSNPTYNRRQLQNLAPLLDRLGRTLIDAAPHMTALADSLPSTRNVESNMETPEVNDDDSIRDSLPDLNMNGGVSNHPPNTGGLLSLWNRERRNQSMHPDEVRSSLLTDEDLDPDYVDFASGVVNTSRGEVRAGPRSRPQNDDVASLLGAYLAAASLSNAVGDDNSNEEGGGGLGAAQSLGSILRERGNGGGGGSGGIDIHIHAVVTTPGGGGGGGGGGGLGGLAGLGGGTIPTATVIGTGNGGGNTGLGGTGRTLFASRDRNSRTSSILRSRHSHTTPAIPVSEEIEDTSLFSELYSENPEPVDPNGSPEPDARRASRPPTVDDHDTDFIRRIAAMNEGDDNDSASTSARRSRNNFRRQSTERRGWGRLFRRRRSHRDSNL